MNGRLDSINLQTGHATDYTSEAKSKFLNVNRSSDAGRECKEI